MSWNPVANMPHTFPLTQPPIDDAAARIAHIVGNQYLCCKSTSSLMFFE